MEASSIDRCLEKILNHFKTKDRNVYNFIKGVSAGADIREEDAVLTILAPALGDDSSLQSAKGDRGNKCMTFSAWGNMTKGNHHLGGANLDYESTSSVAMFSHLVSYPDDGYAVVGGAGVLGNCFNILSANHFLDPSWKASIYEESSDDEPRYATVEKIVQDENGQATIYYGLATSEYAKTQRYAQAAHTTDNIILK